MLPVAAYLALASSALAGPALVSTGITVSPSTIYASPDQTPNFSTTFTLREVGGSAITFTHVALAILHADGSHFFDVGLYTNVTVPANGTWTFPVTWRYLTEPGTYKAIARGRFNNGNWFDFGVTGAGVNPVTFTVLPRTAAFGGRVTSQGAGNPGVDGAVVTWGSYNATTSGGGYYSFPSVPCETQTLTVTKSGYYDHSESYTPICLASNQKNVAVMPWGFASVATGVTVTPPTPYASPAPGVNNISVDFSLRETTGFPVTFAEVAAAILDENGTTLFDLPHQANVTVPANGTWTFPTQSGYLVNPGNYRAIVRGHVAGGNWFDFAVTGAGVNPVTFTVLPRVGFASVETGVAVTPPTPIASSGPGVNNFSVDFTLRETTGAPVTFADVAAAILDEVGTTLFDLPHHTTVSRSANGTWTFPTQSGYLVTPGTYRAIARGRVAGGDWFDFSATVTGVNPLIFNVAARPGFARVESGVAVSPTAPFASPGPAVHNFSVAFALRETTGAPVTFAEVAAAILDEEGTTLFDLPHQANVTIPANGTWTFPTQTGYLLNPGTYRAIARGRVTG